MTLRGQTIPSPRWLQPKFIGPFVLSIIATMMIWWTWGYHTEPMVDFGREIYVAWRLAVGDVLYRDIDYFNGPVSPYFNALIFRLFGATLLTLQIANLVEWAAICVLSYSLYVAIADRLAAFAATLCFILVFSFIQLNNAPIFNYVGPYAHEITQSLLASFGVFALLRRYFTSHNDVILVAIGVVFGLIFMMKIEIAVAIAAALAVALSMDLLARNTSAARWARSIGLSLSGALGTLGVTWVLLRLHMPASVAMRGLLGSWKFLGDRHVTNNEFYRMLSGMNHPWLNTRIMLTVLGAYLVILVPPLVLAWLMKRGKTSIESRAIAAMGGCLYVTVCLWHWWSNRLWSAAALPLNVTAACVLIVFAAIALWRWSARAKAWTPRLVLQVSFAVFAFVMLWKLLLAIPISHYGFVLTVPAMAIFVMFSVSWLPEALRRRQRSAWIARSAVLTLLGLICIHFIQFYVDNCRVYMTETLGSGSNEFHMNFRATALNELMDVFTQKAKPQDTLAMVPQGAMINFLTGRANPTGEAVLLPGEVDFFGEDQILHRFETHPPDWIVMSIPDISQFGFKGFGFDYAIKIAGWIHDNYRDETPADFAAKYPLRLLRFNRAAVARIVAGGVAVGSR